MMKPNTAVCTTLLLALFVSRAAAEQPQIQWQRGPAPPLARGGYYAASLQGGIVLAGGTYWRQGEKLWTDRVDFYDPRQARWTELPSLPVPLAYGGTVRIGDSLYLLGGTHGELDHQQIYRFDTQQRWQRVGKTPRPLYYTSAVAIGTRVYMLAGGSTRDLSEATRQCWVADCAEFQWDKLPQIPGPARVIHTAAVLGDSIYLFGGCRQPRGEPLQNLSDAYRFDTADRTWHRLRDAPLAVRAWWAEPSQGSIYLFGGYTDRFLDHVYRYDPADDQYTLVSHLPLGLADTKFIRHADGHFYGISGEDQLSSRFPGMLIGRPTAAR